ncbi:MAG: hypothetical protein ACI9T7_001836 [Oleiphilaceae bacterium]|jgi:hypothetical protein
MRNKIQVLLISCLFIFGFSLAHAEDSLQGTFEKRISSSLDDVEEQSSGRVSASSSDLELVFDKSNQHIGMRFTGVSLPKGVTVTRAYVQFTTDEKNSGTTSLRIKAHDVDDAPAFTTLSRNVSNRATTNASISWQPAAWNTVGAATSNERTPNIKNVIQEVVSRSGWKSGNDIAIIITGTGERTAESFNGSSNKAPLLHIEYTYTVDSAGGTGEGYITRQVWTDVSGTGLTALTGLSSYPNNPTTTNEITSFEAQSNWANNYGTRIVGYLHAAVSGTYTFWIATDDSGELWLSTNDLASNKQKIASITRWAGVRDWTKFASQKSASITLQAGQRYYIEALQKEGGGGDNIAVAWKRPGGSLEVIPGEYLSPFTGTAPTPTTYTLTINNGSGDNKYVSGAKISIKADTAPSGKVFDRWVANSGNPSIASITASTTTLTMPARGATVTATYKNGVSLRNAENPANTVNGLDYKYYSGSWNALPNFAALTPVEAGSLSNYSINGRLANNNFGFAFKGYINVPTDGTYTFYTNSDDGSKLYIGSTTVVNNDGLHGNVQQSGQIGLKAGKHAVNVDFFERSGGEVLEVRYQGPGISKRLIPSNALYREQSTGGGDTTRPVIRLAGSAQMNIMQGTAFNDPGATATDDRDGNLTGSISRSGSVNTARVGSYALSYNVNDAAGNPARTVARTVNVTLSADIIRPVITLNGNQTMSIIQGTSFSDPGATASDNRDGNISNAIAKSGNVNTANLGRYTLSYNVKDAAGNNATTVTRKVNIILGPDNTAPVITLIGNQTMVIVQGTSFNDPGATASDNRDGNITNAITKSGSVNTATVGRYMLSYNVKDAANNNATTLTRTVNVTSPPRSSAFTNITSPSNGSVFSFGQEVRVTAEAFDENEITVARLWIDDTYHSIDNTAPYVFSALGLSEGEHTLYVRTKNGNGVVLDSDVVTIKVQKDIVNSGNFKLPIEVLGSAGTKKSITFDINDLSGISHLYLRCNACGYHDISLDKSTSKIKATVRVNGGSAIPLKHFIEKGRVYGNNQINIIGGEANYGGIGGGFRTVRLTVPVSGLVRGENTLTFEHLNAEAPSIGFRILELNLLQNGDLSRKVLSDAEFENDDPSNWRAPRDTSSDIAQGFNLWTQRNNLYDIGFDNMDGRGNRQGPINGDMRASCADCHASDGRDLKYFNFSNLSIIERSKFHGLTQADGEKIASYIRDLDIQVVEQARPWNPAYQPGPGLDSRPAYEWAAGAGVDAILDRDSDMAPYLFPNGTSLNAVRDVVDRYDTLNFRELPINIPMPEWNQWLPVIHPDDAFNTSASAIVSDYSGRNVGMPYYKKIYNDAVANPNPTSIGALAVNIKRWLGRGQDCATGDNMRGIDGAVMESLRLPATDVTSSNCNSIKDTPALEPYEIAKRSLTAWSAVKMWEIMHSNNLEQESEKQGERVCSDGRCIDASEPRGWVADGRNVFDRAPHFIGTGGGRKFFTQNPMLGILESNAWYHLNMILNPGYRETMPSHFAYTYSHVELLQSESDIDQGYRFWATMVKQRQLQTNGKYGVEAGLDLRTAQPYVYYGTARNTTKTDTQASVGQPLWGRLAQAMVEDFVEDANNATSSNWANATNNRKVQDRNSTDFSGCGSRCSFTLGKFQGRNTYRVIPKLRDIGVAENVIDDLIDWGQKTWPRGPWNNLR